MSLRHPRRPAARLVAALLLLAACRADTPTGGAGIGAPVTVSAALAGTGVQVLTITVTGPAIRTPIVVNVDVSASVTTATTTIDVPVGGQRTFVARGYDADGVLTHEGITTALVRPTGNPPVGIRIFARTGDMPIGISVGELVVTIAPPPQTGAMVGDTYQLRATITGPDGAPVAGAAVRWASLAPPVAHVSASGLVTALSEGATTLYASYQGAAASIDLAVTPLVFRDVSTGPTFTCAVDIHFAGWCWGDNGGRTLGSPYAVDHVTLPVRVSGGHRFGSIVAGRAHACGVTLGGEAWCWGSGEFGAGQPPSAPVSLPQRVLGGLTWRSLALHWGVTCGITEVSNEAYCWGTGVRGNIGLTGPFAQITTLTTPAPVTTPGPWAELSTSSSVSCGITTSGAAACSAHDGSPVTTASAAGHAWRTLQVDGMERESATSFISVANTPFACGLTNQDEVRCWGHGPVGQLGTGTGTTSATQPMLVAGPQGYGALSVGDDFACGLRGGAAWCWGLNDLGQLGDGTRSNRDLPMPVLGDNRFTRISGRWWHACALRDDGAVYCWGANLWGQLGDGTLTTRATPTRAATRISAPISPTP